MLCELLRKRQSREYTHWLKNYSLGKSNSNHIKKNIYLIYKRKYVNQKDTKIT